MKVPIVITNFNRAEPLRMLLAWCLSLKDVGKVVIVDNGSTYRPTLDLYQSISRRTGIEIVRKDNSLGRHSAKVVAEAMFPSGPVVYTDPDLVMYYDTPNDVLQVCLDLLRDHPQIKKVGPSLEINDVPDCYFNAAWIRHWERQFWTAPLTPCKRGRFAGIDTTFAVYRRASDYLLYIEESIRLERPYRLKHVDWYEDKNNPSEERQYYFNLCNHEASGAVLYRHWKADPAKYDAIISKAIKSNRAMGMIQENFFRIR